MKNYSQLWLDWLDSIPAESRGRCDALKNALRHRLPWGKLFGPIDERRMKLLRLNVF